MAKVTPPSENKHPEKEGVPSQMVTLSSTAASPLPTLSQKDNVPPPLPLNKSQNVTKSEASSLPAALSKPFVPPKAGEVEVQPEGGSKHVLVNHRESKGEEPSENAHSIPRSGSSTLMLSPSSPSVSPPTSKPVITKSFPEDQTTIINGVRELSFEEKRAMHFRYSVHLRNRIVTLSDSIEARLKSLQ